MIALKINWDWRGFIRFYGTARHPQDSLIINNYNIIQNDCKVTIVECNVH